MACTGFEKLRKYQREAVEALASGSKVGVFASAGLGKSAIMLAAWAEQPETPALILTRAVGRHAWVRDARWVLDHEISELWAGAQRSKSGQHRDGSFTSLYKALESGIVVTNYDVVKPRFRELLEVPWRYLILDESHELKMGFCPPKVHERTKERKKRRFEYVLEIAQGVQRRGGTVWILTATPVRDRTRDLWGQLNIVLPRLVELRDRWRWLHHFCDAKKNEWGGLDTTGSSNKAELSAFCQKHFFFATRKSVSDQLPALQRNLVELDANWKIARIGGSIEDAIASAAEQKTEAATELACEYLNEGLKVVLVVSRRRLATRLGQELQQVVRKNVREARRRQLWLQTVTGETEVRARMKLCTDFQGWRGPAALVATMDSIQTSMDLHQASSLIFCALPYTPYGLQQMEGRVGRLGGVPCTVTYLIVKNTIDERIKRLLLGKLRTVEELGVELQGEGGSLETLQGKDKEAEIIRGLKDWLSGAEVIE